MIDHLDLVVASLERSLAYAVFFYDPDEIKPELVHRPAEVDVVTEVRRLAERLERLEQGG